MDHFEGKSVVDHLKEARLKGALGAAEIHGTEMPGHFSAGADASKETALILLILWVIVHFFAPIASPLLFFSVFLFGWLLWKTGRSALLGWARMERLHRVIEEERWEIEHHRQQEREELSELYRAKGLKGKLLEEVIDVLMADDNRLLQVMLEEELGLSLEVYEHPLRQSAGAFCGVLLSAIPLLFCYWISPNWGIPLCAPFLVVGCAILAAKLERNLLLNHVVWNFSLTILIGAGVYLVGTWLK